MGEPRGHYCPIPLSGAPLSPGTQLPHLPLEPQPRPPLSTHSLKHGPQSQDGHLLGEKDDAVLCSPAVNDGQLFDLA